LADGSQFGAGVISTPSPPARLTGSLNETQEVSSSIAGLSPGATYYYRVVATNDSPGQPVVASAPKSLIAYGGAAGPSDVCPNEALRAENGSLALPDCRAYERVTPVVKNGASFGGETFVGDGPRVALATLSTFGGTPSAESLGAAYEFTRGGSGWSTKPLFPSATQFEKTNLTTPLYRGIDGRSLFGLRPVGAPADEENLYVGGAAFLTEVGPMVPAESLIGLPGQISSEPGYEALIRYQLTTPDVSHVIFSLSSPGPHDYLWPFDHTAAGGFYSAYEYAGTANVRPFLVGVVGGEDSATLIGGCGTSVGSLGSEDTYNAISADGSTVFFTPAGEDVLSEPCNSVDGAPAHTELYARLDGETPAARTVKISEPSKEDCVSCQTVNPLTEKPETELREAAFQGASENGSKVFFLTEQELLPGNTGKNLYEYDFEAPPGHKVVAVSHVSGGTESGVQGVVRISEDGSRVYFVADAALTEEPNSTGSTAQPGADNLYAYDTGTGTTRFVATLAPADSEMWSATDYRRPAEATPDGNYLLFSSVADLTPDDSSTVNQLFRYRYDTGQLVRISVGRAGFNGNGNTDRDPVTFPGSFGKYGTTQHVAPQKIISDDGARVFFTSTGALIPNAIEHYEIPGSPNFAQNIYEYHGGIVSLLSDGRDRAPEGKSNASAVELLGTDSTGVDVFFTTASPLVPADEDRSVDIYDARAGGGFADTSAPQCESDGCQSAPPPPGVTPSASSALLQGLGNPVQHKKKAAKKKPPHKKKKPLHKKHKHRQQMHKHGNTKRKQSGHQRTAGGHRGSK
jgi:hypothetical protein